MKKLLALVLALVMTLGLATVGTSAAYTDANDIDYTEAVDVMTAVGVFQGKGDAFAPKDGLNRAEAAKLIAYLMLGNKTAEAMKGSGTRFTDVPASHWAAGFIEYLASVGVVSGVGNGQFNPNGQVTAVQFAKMLLVALGYDAELENFVGEGWSINIQKVANENDLFTSLDISANDALTREQAAQMCLNDLKAEMVEYSDKGTTVKIGESTVVTGAKKADKKTGSGAKATAIDDATNAAGTAALLNLGEDLYSGDLTLSKGSSDDMGRPANVWKYKTTDIGTYAAYGDLIFEQKDEVKLNQVYQALGKTASDDLLKNTTNRQNNGDVAFELYVDGVRMDENTGATTGTNSKIFGGTAALVNKDSSAAIGATAGDSTLAASDWKHYGSKFTGNGTTTQIFLEEDKEVATGVKIDLYTVVITNTYLVQATADYSSAREELKVEWKGLGAWDTVTAAGGTSSFTTSAETTIKQEDFDVSGVKKDDYLIVTYSAAKDSFQSVKPATVVEGEITKYVANDTVTIDGTTYKYAKKVDEGEKNTTYSVGNKAVLITDGTYVICVDDANATKDFVYLQDIGSNSGLNKNVKVALYGTDGTLREVDVKEVTNSAGTKINASTLNSTYANTTTESNLYGWYTYSVDDSGVYTLKAVNQSTSYAMGTVPYDLTSAPASAYKAVDNENVNFLKSGVSTTVSTKANTKTVFIVLDDDDDITVTTGLANAPTVTIKAAANAGETAYVSYINDDGYATYVFIDLSNTSSTTVDLDDSTLSNDYMMVVKTGKNNYDSKNNENSYRNDTVLYDGEIVTKNFDITETATVGKLYHKIKTNSKGFITGKDAIVDNKDYAVGENMNSIGQPIDFNNGTVTIGGKGYLLNSSDAINLILGKASSPAKDPNKDYTEYLKISGSALKSYLQGAAAYSYNYYGIRHDDNSNTLDELYIYVGTTNTFPATITSNYNDGKNYTSDTNVKAGSYTISNGTTVAVNGTLDIPTGVTLVIDGATVSANAVTYAGDGKITVQNGGKLFVDGALSLSALTVSGCEVTVGKAANIGTLTVQGKLHGSTEDAVVTFNGEATITNAYLKADSVITFNGTGTNGNKITNIDANGADIVMNETVNVANGSITGGSITKASGASLTGGATIDSTVAVEGDSAKTMTVNIKAISDFDVDKFSATGLTYTYEVGKDTIVLTFLANEGSVTYEDASFGQISEIKDKKATVEATLNTTATKLTLKAEELNGVTVTVTLKDSNN